MAQAYFKAKHREDRLAAERDVPAHQCEYVDGCDRLTTVHRLTGRGWVRSKMCRKHAQLEVVLYLDPKTGQTLNIPRHEVAQRHRHPYDIRVATPAKTHRTRRRLGWQVTNHGHRADAAQLRARLQSEAFRLTERLGEIWKKEAGLKPNLASIMHPEARPKHRPRKEWLPKDPYELLRVARAVELAHERGQTFVAIGRTVGRPYGWLFRKDGHGNLASCRLASALYRFALTLHVTMPGWASLTARMPRQANTAKSL